MTCGWFREIELQKTFKMSPTEARYFAMYDHGLSQAKIAELDRVSIHTVGAVLQRARDKMKKVRGELQELIIIKGHRDQEASAIKEHAMAVVMTFVADILGAKFHNGQHIMVLRGIDSATAGDQKWMQDHVFRKVDIYGATNDAEIQKRVDRLKEVYAEEVGTEECKVGIGTVRFYLDQMYMQYEILEG